MGTGRAGQRQEECMVVQHEAVTWQQFDLGQVCQTSVTTGMLSRTAS